MIFTNVKLVDSAVMEADVASRKQSLNMFDIYTIQAIWTGTVAGSIMLQASCDICEQDQDVVNWSTISDSGATVSNAGDILWNVDAAAYKWVRVFFDFTSGSGILNVRFNGKGK
jgi:hypothetical protein